MGQGVPLLAQGMLLVRQIARRICCLCVAAAESFTCYVCAEVPSLHSLALPDRTSNFSEGQSGASSPGTAPEAENVDLQHALGGGSEDRKLLVVAVLHCRYKRSSPVSCRLGRQ